MLRLRKGISEFATVSVFALLPALMGASFLVGAISPASAAELSVESVFNWDGLPPPVGSSVLVRTGSGVAVTLETSGLTDGHTHTVWFVVFNVPSACAGDPCGEADLFEFDVAADVLYAAGDVVGNGDKGNFAGHLNVGDTDGSIADLFDLPNANGLLDAEGAEIHLVVRSHGPKIPGEIQDQINSFEGGCTVDLPAGTIPDDPGECADIQFSIHQP